VHDSEHRDLSADELTRAVLASFAGAGDERFKEIAESLVRHLHAFATEVGLTEEEWFTGVDFLTRAGRLSNDKRQELILLSDVLGLSMLVIGLAHPAGSGATESTVFGPFFVEGSPAIENGGDLGAGAPGRPCFMSGRILSTTGEPIGGASIEVWQADEDGFYDVQRPELAAPQGRGHLTSAADGRFAFWSVLPEAYPIPTDGPVGELLAAAGRGPMRPAHVHFMVQASGYGTLITHVFVAGDEYLDRDAVFGVKSSLIAPFERHEPGTAPDGRAVDTPFYTLTYDLVLEPDAERA
jgi:hydroxyquinol 1,2-dioxygenase